MTALGKPDTHLCVQKGPAVCGSYFVQEGDNGALRARGLYLPKFCLSDASGSTAATPPVDATWTVHFDEKAHMGASLNPKWVAEMGMKNGYNPIHARPCLFVREVQFLAFSTSRLSFLILCTCGGFVRIHLGFSRLSTGWRTRPTRG